MADTLDAIMFDLSETLSAEYQAELIVRIREGTELATVEAILRLSFKSPDGGNEIRRRIFTSHFVARQDHRKEK